MKKIIFPIICVCVGYLLGVGQPGIMAGGLTSGSGHEAMAEHFVQIEDAYVQNGIRAVNESWEIGYNTTYGKSYAIYDYLKLRPDTSLDNYPQEEGVILMLSSPVVLNQFYNGEWRMTDFVAQADWVSGETVTDVLYFCDDQWWAAESGPILIQ